MDKKTYDRIHDRVHKKFQRRAKRVAGTWTEIEIDGKNFEDTLEIELGKEDQKIEDSVQRRIDEFLFKKKF